MVPWYERFPGFLSFLTAGFYTTWFYLLLLYGADTLLRITPLRRLYYLETHCLLSYLPPKIRPNSRELSIAASISIPFLIRRPLSHYIKLLRTQIKQLVCASSGE